MMEKEALRVENACGRFLKLAVLDHFNFSANSGEICCLFGAHNAGKTVFMQLLAGKLAGEWSMRLLLDGVDVHWSPGNNPVAALFAFIWDEAACCRTFRWQRIYAYSGRFRFGSCIFGKATMKARRATCLSSMAWAVLMPAGK